MLIQLFEAAVGSDVTLVPGPLAAAIGAGLDVQSGYAQMVVDVGEGTTEVAVIRAGALIIAVTSCNGCARFHDALRDLAWKHYGIVLCRGEAERLTRELGAAPGTVVEKSLIGIGIDPNAEAEAGIRFTGMYVNQAIHPPILELAEVINGVLLALPDDIACEVIESGICLTGGGACLRGMVDFLHAATRIDISVASDPVHAAIDGAGKMLENGWFEGSFRDVKSCIWE